MLSNKIGTLVYLRKDIELPKNFFTENRNYLSNQRPGTGLTVNDMVLYRLPAKQTNTNRLLPRQQVALSRLARQEKKLRH